MFRVGISFLGFLEFSFHSFLKSKEKVVQLHFRFHHLHRWSWRTPFLPKNWRTILRNRKSSLVTTRIWQKMRSWQRSKYSCIVWTFEVKNYLQFLPIMAWTKSQISNGLNIFCKSKKFMSVFSVRLFQCCRQIIT